MGSKYDNMIILDKDGHVIHRMTCAERAKIFMPFDALKGLRAALAETEKEMEKTGDTIREKSPFSEL